MFQPKPETLREDLLAVTERLRLPAGDDERFQSMESIRANRDPFVAAVHATWKELHFAAVQEIIKAEAALQHAPPDREFRSYLKFVRQIWRKVSDSIVWVIVGERHVIKRVCKNRSRPFLKDANLRDSLYILKQFNEGTDEIAIWNDATSCVDVGDFTYRGPKIPGGYSFVELNAGVVNEAIGELLNTKGEVEDKVAALKILAEKHGDKAVRQFERTLKQSIQDNQLLTIANQDEGFDPIQNAYVRVWDPGVEQDSYDDQLELWLARSADGEQLLGTVDECLHVFVSRDRGDYDARKATLVRHLRETHPEAVNWNETNTGEPLYGAVTLDQSLFEPLAAPVFLRPFAAENVADLLYGSLFQRVWIFFDWNAFSSVVEGAGGRLVWTTKREGRRERSQPGGPRHLVIGDRVPRIELPDGFGIRLGSSEVVRVLFDGVTPSTIAREYVNLLRLAQTHAEEQRSG